MNRSTSRQVLECASPLALSHGRVEFSKRQMTAAVQDAGALTRAGDRFMVSMRAQTLEVEAVHEGFHTLRNSLIPTHTLLSQFWLRPIVFRIESLCLM